MCGVAGIVNWDHRPVDVVALGAMADSLRHRGPDDEGYLLVDTRTGAAENRSGKDTTRDLTYPPLEAGGAEAFNLGLGFRRLSILDLSAAGHQPMASADRRCWIVFNGEIYNYLELRAELEGRGFRFHTGTDTEVILAAYQHWGRECLGHFNGMWAFAIWDSRQRCLFLARDRFGIKPLYYTNGGGRFAFASEIKALVGPQGIPFRPDGRAIFQYLVNAVLPGQREGATFFAGVSMIPPGCWLHVAADGTVHRGRYWNIPSGPERAPSADVTEVLEEMRSLLTDSIRLRLRSDVPVGSCLSGGMDSSAIVAIINRLIAEGGVPLDEIGDRQKTFSVFYEEQGPFNERRYMDSMLAAIHADSHFLRLEPDRIRTDLDRLCWHQDEPFLSTSVFAQWCVMSLVRERGVTVSLDGQGSDEMLGGYQPFVQHVAGLVRRHRYAAAFSEARAIQSHGNGTAWALLRQAAAAQLPADRGVLALWRRRSVSAAMDISLLSPAFAQQFREAHLVPWREKSDLDLHLRTLTSETSLPHLLRFEDRNSMAHSVEARVPFLDYRIVEFCFTGAAPWRIHDGWTKWVLRKAMEHMVPSANTWRTDKVGFGTPEVTWVRSLADLMAREAENPLLAEYLDAPKAKAIWAKNVHGIVDARDRWRWLNLGTWLRLWSSQ